MSKNNEAPKPDFLNQGNLGKCTPPKKLSVSDIAVGPVYDATHAVGEALKELTPIEIRLVLAECLAYETQEDI